MTGVDESLRWRFLAAFLEEYSWEDAEVRHGLLSEEPETVGEQTWDVLLAALAEHLAARDGKAAPGWSQTRTLRRFWFPFNTPAARVDAVVTAPAAFRRRGSSSPPMSWTSRDPPSGREMTASGPLLDRAGIEAAFRRLGERLTRRGVVADIYVFGGAAMAMAYDSRRATRDIDAIFVPPGIVLEEAREVGST